MITNGSFENGAWTGTASFVDADNATDVSYPGNVFTGWRSYGFTPWVQDAQRAEDGSRMVFITPGWFINQYVSTSGLQAGQTYHLTINYDFFDPTDIDGGMDSSIQIRLETGYFMGSMEMPLTSVANYVDIGMSDNWVNVGAMDWQTFSLDFTMPSLAGADYLNVSIWSLNNSPGTPSMGVLVDNISLSLAVIPELGSLLFALLGLMLQRRCR